MKFQDEVVEMVGHLTLRVLADHEGIVEELQEQQGFKGKGTHRLFALAHQVDVGLYVRAGLPDEVSREGIRSFLLRLRKMTSLIIRTHSLPALSPPPPSTIP